MFWRKTKQQPNPPAMDADVEDAILSVAEAFESVVWARETLESLLTSIEFHKADCPDCDVWCLPPEFQSYVQDLAPEYLRILLVTMIKDCVMADEC